MKAKRIQKICINKLFILQASVERSKLFVLLLLTNFFNYFDLLRETCLFLADKKTEELLSPNPADKVEQKAPADAYGDATATNSNLKDPDRYCSLCAVSFNNPQMALQHYNGRRHQRNKARQELLKKLGDDVQQGT